MAAGYSGTIAGIEYDDGVAVGGAVDDRAALAAVRAHVASHPRLVLVDGRLLVVDVGERVVVDAREVDTPTVVGTPLRDAAVDPRPSDFLPPTNAGQADPHGPDVVAPGVHAIQGAKPLVGGEVADTAAVQEATETAAVADAANVELVEPPHSGAGSGKDAWVTFALAQGADPDEVGLMTSDALVERYGSGGATEG